MFLHIEGFVGRVVETLHGMGTDSSQGGADAVVWTSADLLYSWIMLVDL